MEYNKKYKNLFTKYCEIVKRYLINYNKYLNNKYWLMWSFDQYVAKSGLKGLKGLLVFYRRMLCIKMRVNHILCLEKI